MPPYSMDWAEDQLSWVYKFYYSTFFTQLLTRSD
jgi:hypothetical protein